MSTTLPKKLTYEDYIQMTQPDSAQYQLIHGEIITTTSPNTRHQRIIINLTYYLQTYLMKKNIGQIFVAPMDVIFENENIFQPDLLFISHSRKNIIEESRINSVPNLIVEVLSPSNAYYDLVLKKKVYEACGVSEYWIVDPNLQTLDLYILSNEKFQLKIQLEKKGIVPSEVFPGIELDIEKIFI